MRYFHFLLSFTLFLSGCSSVPSQTPLKEYEMDPPKNSFTWIGVQIESEKNKWSSINQKKIVIVRNIYPMSPAMEAGLIKDDIILSINGNKIIDHIDFVKRVKEYSPPQDLELKIFRNKKFLDLKVKTQKYDMEAYVSKVLEYVKSFGNDDFAHLILGDYFKIKKLYKKALVHYRRAVTINPKNSTALAESGYVLGFEMGEYSKAIEDLSRAISLSPNTFNHHFNLGLIYSLNKQPEHAIREFLSAIKISPNDYDSHYWLGEEYRFLKQYEQAIKEFEEATRIRPKNLDARFSLGKIKRSKGDNNGAILEFKDILKYASKEIELDKNNGAELFIELGNAYYAEANYDESEKSYLQAIQTYKDLNKIDSKKYIDLLNYLGNTYYAARKYQKALTIYEEARSLTESIYGQGDLKNAYSFEWLGNTFYAIAKYSEAEESYLQAIQIYKDLNKIDSGIYLNLFNALGNTYYGMGDYEKSEKQYRYAVAGYEKYKQDKSFGMIVSLHGIANSLYAGLKIRDAENYYIKAVDLQKKLIGKDSYYASILGNLGSLYYQMGAQYKAEKILLEVVQLQKEDTLKGIGDGAWHIGTLGLIYFERLEFDLALKYFQSAREAVNQLYGGKDKSAESALILHNISRVYFAQGKYDKALELGEKALNLIPKNENRHLDTFAQTKMGMAEIYRMKGQFKLSKKLFSDSLDILERVHEENSIWIASNLIGAARLDADLGNYDDAWNKIQRAVRITEKDIDLKYEYTAEHEKIAYFRTLDADFYISLVNALSANRGVLEEAYGVILRLKNNALFTSMDQGGEDLKTKKIKGIINIKRSQLTRLAYSKSDDNNSESIKEEIFELERKLSRVGFKTRREKKEVNLKTITANMPPNSILIDFLKVSLNSFDGKSIAPPGHFISAKEKEKFNAHHYIAIVYSKDDDKLSMHDLGLAVDIDRTILKYRSDIQALIPTEKIKYIGNKLYKFIFSSLPEKVIKKLNIFVSPDSNLALLPFETLVDNNGNYLVNNYKFTYINSGRDFIKFNSTSINSGLVALFGNPDFDYNIRKTPKKSCQDNKKEPNRCPELSKLSFASLAGTEREVNQIKEVFTNRNVKTFKSQLATETALKEIDSPHILHIATHGFFLKNINVSDANMKTRGITKVPNDSKTFNDLSSQKKIKNPLLASGLALSGANNFNIDLDIRAEEDGIVSAMEIMGLNLSGTNLVVLSACNTGVGDVERGQGIFGLRRAFQIAGAKSLLTTLWKIPDRETVDLMRRFYLNFSSGKSKIDSLNLSIKDTILEIKNIRGTDHPFYWGGFILIGDPGLN